MTVWTINRTNNIFIYLFLLLIFFTYWFVNIFSPYVCSEITYIVVFYICLFILKSY